MEPGFWLTLYLLKTFSDFHIMKFPITTQAELKVPRNAQPIETYCLNIQKVQSDKLLNLMVLLFLHRVY